MYFLYTFRSYTTDIDTPIGIKNRVSSFAHPYIGGSLRAKSFIFINVYIFFIGSTPPPPHIEVIYILYKFLAWRVIHFSFTDTLYTYEFFKFVHRRSGYTFSYGEIYRLLDSFMPFYICIQKLILGFWTGYQFI